MPPTESHSTRMGKSQPNDRMMKLKGCVNFGTLPDQIVAKALQKGFVFNVMCIGETGIGKTTLMESLYGTNFETTETDHFEHSSAKLRTNMYHLVENSVSLKLTVTDTLGFGDQIHKGDTYGDLAKYIDAQFETYLQEELKVNRSMDMYHDTRVHLVLYFICPTGHGLKSLDLLVMKELCPKVNVLPIIAKADTMSKADLPKFRRKILEELANNDIKIYKFPTDEESVHELNTAMNAIIPFAVVGSTDFVKIGNKTIRCRQYPWGIVEVENENHCDFVKLRDMMICTNMEDMKEVTHFNHYEKYRAMRLEQMGFTDVDVNNEPVSFQQRLEAKCNSHMIQIHQKEEEMRENFIHRVKKKETELRETEKEMQERHEKISREQIAKEAELEETQKKLEEAIAELNRRKAQMASGGSSGGGSTHTLTLGKISDSAIFQILKKKNKSRFGSIFKERASHPDPGPSKPQRWSLVSQPKLLELERWSLESVESEQESSGCSKPREEPNCTEMLETKEELLSSTSKQVITQNAEESPKFKEARNHRIRETLNPQQDECCSFEEGDTNILHITEL